MQTVGLGNNDMSMNSLTVTKIPLWWEMLTMGEIMHVLRAGVFFVWLFFVFFFF
jgi:hypothetical protein